MRRVRHADARQGAHRMQSAPRKEKAAAGGNRVPHGGKFKQPERRGNSERLPGCSVLTEPHIGQVKRERGHPGQMTGGFGGGNQRPWGTRADCTSASAGPRKRKKTRVRARMGGAGKLNKPVLKKKVLGHGAR